MTEMFQEQLYFAIMNITAKDEKMWQKFTEHLGKELIRRWQQGFIAGFGLGLMTVSLLTVILVLVLE